MGKGGQIWLKCTTVDLIMMIRYKKNIFERVENFHADLAWNHPGIEQDVTLSYDKIKQTQFWFYTVKLLFRFT